MAGKRLSKWQRSSKEFQEAAVRKQPAAGDALSDDEKGEVLDRLVDDALLYQKALTLGLDKDPKVRNIPLGGHLYVFALPEE